MKSKNNYVYVYERLGKPLYVGIGSTNDQVAYGRARDIRKGHPEFYMWCKERFGGFRRVLARIVAENLTRMQARLIEGVLIAEHSKHHDIFNRIGSTLVVDKYVVVFRKRGSARPPEEISIIQAARSKRRRTTKPKKVKRVKRTLSPEEKLKERALYQAAYRAKKNGDLELYAELEAKRDALRFESK